MLRGKTLGRTQKTKKKLTGRGRFMHPRGANDLKKEPRMVSTCSK